MSGGVSTDAPGPATDRVSPAWATPSAPWHSGPWSLDRRDDELADIRFDGQLVLRAVRLVVRDGDWNTPVMRVDEARSTHDTLVVALRSDGFGAAVSGTLTVTAGARSLAVEWRGSSAVDYLTNRTGLVVLQPPHLAGTAVDVAHPDGTVEHATLPRAVAPRQPVRDVAALSWHDHGLAVTTSFAGDVFEMEDQRNWTDASYKVYSRPLALPFPYRLAAGEELWQRVEIRASGRPTAPVAPPDDHLTLTPAGAFPAVGTSAATAPDPAPGVPAVGDTLLVELDLASPTWRAALARAGRTGQPLDVRLVLPPGPADTLDDASVAAIGDAVAALAPHPLCRVAAFARRGHSTRRAHVDALRAALAAAGRDVPVLAGVRSHFTELNRQRHLVPRDVDGLTFATTPLFHAHDTGQLVESVAMQRLVAQETVALADGLPVHVGPVTLRPRFNDVAADPAPAPAVSDARQGAPELAAWTVASAAALAVAGVASLTYFEAWGPRGLRDELGAPYPAAAAVDALAALAGSDLRTGDSPDGLVWAVGGRRGGRTTVLVANLSRRRRQVTVAVDGGTGTALLAPFAWDVVEVPARA